LYPTLNTAKSSRDALRGSRKGNNMPETKDKAVRVEFDRRFIEKWLNYQRYVWYSVILLLAITLTGLLGAAQFHLLLNR
jgi:hypothetical protein